MDLFSNVEPVPNAAFFKRREADRQPAIVWFGQGQFSENGCELRVLDQNVDLLDLCVPINLAMSI